MLISHIQPSVQKLVGNVAQDALVYLNEESCHTDAFAEDISGVLRALADLRHEFSASLVDPRILQEALLKSNVRVPLKNQRYAETVCHTDWLNHPTTDHTSE